MRAKICPISGPEKLSGSERARRAREIIAESGADTVGYFNKVVQQKVAWTFREQAACWLESARKRKPVAPSTIEDWERVLKNWMNPNVGDLPLSEINNGALKKLVAVMSKAGLSAKTIETYTGVAKMVVASAVNSEGEQLYPRKWKRPSAERDVDLHPAIAGLLKAYVGERKSGFLFSSRNGKPVSSSNVIRRHLHPALKKLKYVNPHTGTHKAGNHAFRRFRNTFLRNKTQCPEGLRNYWMGHSGDSMDDLYDKVKEDVQFRKTWAEKCGFGFELCSVVPNVPKIAKKTKAQKAA
jgi:integrase